MAEDIFKKLESRIQEDKKKYSLWAFLASHGSSHSTYSSGYLQCLNDIDDLLKQISLEQRSINSGQVQTTEKQLKSNRKEGKANGYPFQLSFQL
ncbi:hypothetical protein POF51_29480 [Brevibacillus sp. AG]|uniref:hypothetical protein n=1 Tax=Brevibacillus sp. AG TaxID=3020891 RepID=UPI00232F258E|nr:hypothetical protein [Brevibacillus sp. AG]MDC0764856.1 hypothetical protein [Brevibacillus sp. AG]